MTSNKMPAGGGPEQQVQQERQEQQQQKKQQQQQGFEVQAHGKGARSRTSIHLLVQELGHDLLQGGSVRCIKRQDLGGLGSSGATWTGHTDR
jgi:hypothetical protein